MRIFLILIIGIMLSNCSSSYVKNKKTITSPNDLQKFVNVYCNKNKQTLSLIFRNKMKVSAQLQMTFQTVQKKYLRKMDVNKILSQKID